MEQKRRNSMSKFFHPHLSRRKKQIKEKKRSYCQNATALPSHTAPVRRHTAVIHSSSFKKIRYSR
jgi:hypothetical protein